jgi:GNAT superfamily N-acetyltransferase
MRIRVAESADYEAVAKLTVAAYRALSGWVGDDYGKLLEDVAGRVASGATVLVAEDEATGTVLASVTLTLEDGPLFEWEWGVDGDCGFRMLAVDPSAWGRGVGRALVIECLERARAAGRTRMVIGSTPWMTTAHRIYESLGFRRQPQIDQMWGDIHGMAFARDLTDAGGTRAAAAH